MIRQPTTTLVLIPGQFMPISYGCIYLDQQMLHTYVQNNIFMFAEHQIQSQKLIFEKSTLSLYSCKMECFALL